MTTNAGGPFGFLTVIARGNGVSRDARTDGDGRFEIHDLPAGAYTLVFQGERDNPRQSPPRLGSKEVTVTDGATEIVNVVLTPYVEPVDRGPCCKPYGAPPARRRVV